MNAVRQYVTCFICCIEALDVTRQSDIRDTYPYCVVGTSVILFTCTPAECLLHWCCRSADLSVFVVVAFISNTKQHSCSHYVSVIKHCILDSWRSRFLMTFDDLKRLFKIICNVVLSKSSPSIGASQKSDFLKPIMCTFMRFYV